MLLSSQNCPVASPLSRPIPALSLSKPVISTTIVYIRRDCRSSRMYLNPAGAVHLKVLDPSAIQNPQSYLHRRYLIFSYILAHSSLPSIYLLCVVIQFSSKQASENGGPRVPPGSPMLLRWDRRRARRSVVLLQGWDLSLDQRPVAHRGSVHDKSSAQPSHYWIGLYRRPDLVLRYHLASHIAGRVRLLVFHTGVPVPLLYCRLCCRHCRLVWHIGGPDLLLL
ncbi:hypothetical protein QBC47DRAFT_5091 [Echria macrotheca]|uniref:Uncharacterized protein n=1 Tax=Echria macrotheca TaxID=438768 RepID=A0AAJ0BNF6_9PEZI|nr:hypothetical protein QBC47DRAFT_5091 [Echria macrotheca]